MDIQQNEHFLVPLDSADDVCSGYYSSFLLKSGDYYQTKLDYGYIENKNQVEIRAPLVQKPFRSSINPPAVPAALFIRRLFAHAGFWVAAGFGVFLAAFILSHHRRAIDSARLPQAYTVFVPQRISQMTGAAPDQAQMNNDMWKKPTTSEALDDLVTRCTGLAKETVSDNVNQNSVSNTSLTALEKKVSEQGNQNVVSNNSLPSLQKKRQSCLTMEFGAAARLDFPRLPLSATSHSMTEDITELVERPRPVYTYNRAENFLAKPEYFIPGMNRIYGARAEGVIEHSLLEQRGQEMANSSWYHGHPVVLVSEEGLEPLLEGLGLDFESAYWLLTHPQDALNSPEYPQLISRITNHIKSIQKAQDYIIGKDRLPTSNIAGFF